MLPRDLNAEKFFGYPPRARTVVITHLAVLQQLPLSFVPSLLREVVDYDFKFPAERAAIDGELSTLGALSAAQVGEWFQAFSQIRISAQLQASDWVDQPGQFVEQLSADLWTTHQLDEFRMAASAYGDRLRATAAPESLPAPRLGIAVIGKGVGSYEAPLFRNLREHGTYFGRVNPENGLELLLNAVTARAKAHPLAYGHWYIDGGQEADHSPLLTCVSYQGLAPVRSALLRNIQTEMARPGMGPEQLRTHLARLTPEELGSSSRVDPVLARFEIKLLTEGSGTQIFSTTFAQWTAREALRRAQPLTLLVRFAPRQRQRPMNELLSGEHEATDLDLAGSVVDADMGAYYHWLNQQRLAGAEEASFLVWFEDHGQALVVSPSMARGAESKSAANLAELLRWAAG